MCEDLFDTSHNFIIMVKFHRADISFKVYNSISITARNKYFVES